MFSISVHPKVEYFGNGVCYNTCANFVLIRETIKFEKYSCTYSSEFSVDCHRNLGGLRGSEIRCSGRRLFLQVNGGHA